MSTSTRIKYRTRNSTKIENNQEPKEVYNRERRNLRPKPLKNHQLCFTFEELELNTAPIQDFQDIFVQEKKGEEMSPGKIQEMEKACRPPPKNKKKNKYRIKQIFDPLLKTQKTTQNQPSNERQLNYGQTKIPELIKPIKFQLPDCSPEQQKQKIQELTAKLLQISKERRLSLQQQINLLAKLKSKSKAQSEGSDCFQQEYRKLYESRSFIQFRQLAENCETEENIMRQQIKFNLIQTLQQWRHYSEAIRESEKQLLAKYREIAYKQLYQSKDMDQTEQLQKKQKQCQQKMNLNPFNYIGNRKKRRNLQILQTINEKMSVSKPNQYEQKLYQAAANAFSVTNKPKNLFLANKQLSIPYQTESDFLNKSASDYGSHQKDHQRTVQPQPSNLDNQAYLEEKRMQYKKHLLETLPETLNAIQTENTHARQKILKMIHEINDKIEQKQLNPTEENYQQKNQFVTHSTTHFNANSHCKSPKKLTSSHLFTQTTQCLEGQLQYNHQNLLEGLEDIEIPGQSIDNSQPTVTKLEQSISSYRADYRKFNLHSENYQSFCRGPKVKRLEILNRFSYNPFEEGNGEDQCDLWRKLMSQQVQNLKSYYKYEEPNQYFAKENQKLQKGLVLPLKVSQQDFFIKTLYDPSSKSLKQEVFQESSADEFHLTQQRNSQNLTSNLFEDTLVKAEVTVSGISEAKPQFIDQKLSEPKLGTTDQPMTSTPEQQKKEDPLEKSFNLDELQDFQLPELQNQEVISDDTNDIPILKSQDEKLFEIQFF